MRTNHSPLVMGDDYPVDEVKRYNRTGATLLKGQIAMLDILGTQAESVNLSPGGDEGASIYHNLTPAATAGLQGYPMYVALEDVADNAIGRFAKSGRVEMAIGDDDAGGAAINRGEFVAVANGAKFGDKQSNGERAIALLADADGAADSTVTARTVDASSHLRWVLFWGGIPGYGNNVDA